MACAAWLPIVLMLSTFGSLMSSSPFVTSRLRLAALAQARNLHCFTIFFALPASSIVTMLPPGTLIDISGVQSHCPSERMPQEALCTHETECTPRASPPLSIAATSRRT
jgi:hypothetical protein